MNSIKTTNPIIGYWDSRQGGRSENQDSCGFLDTPHGHLAVVCDGMGGGPAGKLASTIAVQNILGYVGNAPVEEKPAEVMRKAVESAQQAILEEVGKRPELNGMGTTVAAVLIGKEAAVVAHVGDSRVYQFRRGKKIFRTEDHSWVAEMVRNKSLTEEQARLSSQSNIITRALGGKSDELADIDILPYEEGDRFMLCTDGIWGMLTEKELVQRAAQTPSLAGTVDGLVLEVDEEGRHSGNTHDNLTLAIIETKSNSIKKGKMRKKDRLLIRALLAICVILFLTTFYYCSKASKDTSKEELEQAVKMNEDLKASNDSLHKEIRKTKEDLADAQKEIAVMKTRDADKALRDAEQKQREAQEAQEKAQQSQSVVEAISHEVLRNIDEAINFISNASRTGPIDQRKRRIEDAKGKLNTLIAIDSQRKNIYSDVLTKLDNSIATGRLEEAKGHFNLLIKKLEKIKQ